MGGVVSTLFLPFNTGGSLDHAKDKNYVIFTPILLQRQSAFSALAKKAALDFVQLAELAPLFGKKQQKHKKYQQQEQHPCHRTVKHPEKYFQTVHRGRIVVPLSTMI